MNKSALKQFATKARIELLKKVEARALKLGVTAHTIESADVIFLEGKPLSKEESVQRNRLVAKVKEVGFKQVTEEVAYTWFNRFTALRFMEVNDYLPTRVRVLSSSIPNSTEPDMMTEALSLDLDLDNEYVYELKMNNESEKLFKYLIIKHCNDLNSYLPFMFEEIDDHSEILFPEGLLAADSFLREMTDVTNIPESNWGKIEVIGWLYQYYIADEKDRVFKARKKYQSEEIPFATQLFTPDWIVRYMVQNSLGRYWIESRPEQIDLSRDWEFYIENKAVNPGHQVDIEQIKCFDPAMGSGHILVYIFDVLYEIYLKNGYLEREIPRLIIENNLYGLDIDRRAFQLASFSIVMKALEYNKRFLRSIKKDSLRMNLAAIEETNGLTDEEIAYFSGDEKVKAWVTQFIDAKSIGSLTKLGEFDLSYLEKRLKSIQTAPITDLFESEIREKVVPLFSSLIKQSKIMGQSYDIVITNPPYMGAKSMNKPLSDYLKKHYPDSKADLFAAFMELDHFIKKQGFYACINQHSWMFLSSFEKLRYKIIETKQMETMIHLGPRAFEEIGGEVVQSTAYVLRNDRIHENEGVFIRVVEERTAGSKRDKIIAAIENADVPYRYSFDQANFKKIPATPIAYWATHTMQQIFSDNVKLGEKANPRQGLATGNNERFIREWFEVSHEKIGFGFSNLEDARASGLKWFPMNKGGSFRKWYGNNESVLAFDEENYQLLAVSGNKLPSRQFYFKEGITWSKVSSSTFSVRYSEAGFIFSDAGMKVFVEPDMISYLCSFLNSKLVDRFLGALSETMNYEKGNIERLPVKVDVDTAVKNEINQLFFNNIDISKRDWDSFETSWDFATHPLLKHKRRTIKESFNEWADFTEQQLRELKENEEELNRKFIQIYGLENEMTPQVEEKDISVQKANVEREIKSFVSYAIGCSLGRYSLDETGLIYAGGAFDLSRYQTIPVDEDNILPIIDGAYFEDDLVTKVIDFVKVTFGHEGLEENLEYIADVLGRRKNETSTEALRRYLMNEFYKDHARMYRNRPIYWFFTSGKEKAFNCLVYMHRYDRTTLARIRTDYLHECQTRLATEVQNLTQIIEEGATSQEVNQAKRTLRTLDKKIDELKKYDELLHHMADRHIEIDLDAGVKVNYEKFDVLVAKI